MGRKLGIFAGGGELPGRIIQACITSGRAFHVIAIEDQADPKIIGTAPHTWIRLGAAQKALEVSRREKFYDIVLVGPIKRPTIRALRPDFLAAKVLARASTSSVMGDDGLLRAIINQIEEFGFNVIGADKFLTEHKLKPGNIGCFEADEEALIDIKRGVQILQALGPVDVGQAVIVQDNIVIAIEASEGTDAMIERSLEHLNVGPGGILVKLPKPEQEKRVDLPTIGPETIYRAHKAGLRGIAIDSDNTLLIDKDKTIELANKKGVFLLALDMSEWAEK